MQPKNILIGKILHRESSAAVLANSLGLGGRELDMTESERRTPNKLVYKNRWLISADLAALKRAGIECNIIVAYHDQRDTARSTVRRGEIVKH